ncbi:MAG: IclR family transcriptional regulator [Ornithinimicrobium sp.]
MDIDSRDTSTGGTTSADRVADVLLLFSQAERPLGVSEVARALGLSKAVVHRILQSLSTRSLLRLAPRGSGYLLGPAATTLAIRAWSQMDVRAFAAPVLRSLRLITRETITLSVLVGHQRIYLDQYQSPQEIKMVVELGHRYPLHSGASSRAILAFLPESFAEEARRQLEVSRPGVDVEAYLALATTRELGYATSLDERGTGAASIAAPFFDAADNVMGSISSSGPVSRYGPERHRQDVGPVVEAARELTADLRGTTR